MESAWPHLPHRSPRAATQCLWSSGNRLAGSSQPHELSLAGENHCIRDRGEQVHLRGVRTSALPPIAELDAYELHRMEVCNDIWTAALVTVERTDKPEPAPPPNIQKLLSKYAEVFAEPKVLPPKWQYNHAINLEPGTTPINTRPYRYSPAQKEKSRSRFRRCCNQVSLPTARVHMLDQFCRSRRRTAHGDSMWFSDG